MKSNDLAKVDTEKAKKTDELDTCEAPSEWLKSSF
jgi:hypothetical protein